MSRKSVAFGLLGQCLKDFVMIISVWRPVSTLSILAIALTAGCTASRSPEDASLAMLLKRSSSVASQKERWEASQALDKLDESSAMALIRLLGDEDSDVRDEAAQVLIHHQKDWASPDIAPILNDPSSSGTRSMVQWAVQDVGERCLSPDAAKRLFKMDPFIRAEILLAAGCASRKSIVPFLLNELRDEKSDHRLLAIQSLAKIGDKCAAAPIVSLLSDEDHEVRFNAMEALIRLHEESTAPDIEARLSYEPPEVRKLAIWTLADVSDRKRAAHAVAKLLEDKDDDVRRIAGETLGKLGEASVIPDLLPLLSHPDEAVRWASAYATGLVCKASSTPPEIALLLKDKHPEARGSAALVLGFSRNQADAAKIIQLLNDREPSVRSKAVLALGWLGEKPAAPRMVKLLEDPDLGVRYSTGDALGNLGEKHVASDIAVLLEHRDPQVRESATYALARLTGQPWSVHAEEAAKTWWKLHRTDPDFAPSK